MSELFTDDIIKILLSLLIGATIGAEREYRSKAAGFRTVILVTVGSCLFSILSIQLGGDSDKTRIAANIVTGIGFLGAGAIYRDKISIRGLTTATTIWISAALGMAVGFGQFYVTIVVTCIVMLILLSFNWFQRIIEGVNQEKNYKIKFDNNALHIRHIENLFTKYDLGSTRIKQERNGDEITILFSAEGGEKNHEIFTEALFQEPDIKSFEV